MMTEILDCNTLNCVYNDNTNLKCKRKRIIIDKNRECAVFSDKLVIEETEK
jgi:hypothetical protein